MNLLRNRLKLKRPQTARAFRQEIDRMYEEIAAQAAEKPKL
jgi:long-chain acyl-CoA synthetase